MSTYKLGESFALDKNGRTHVFSVVEVIDDETMIVKEQSSGDAQNDIATKTSNEQRSKLENQINEPDEDDDAEPVD